MERLRGPHEFPIQTVPKAFKKFLGSLDFALTPIIRGKVSCDHKSCMGIQQT